MDSSYKDKVTTTVDDAANMIAMYARQNGLNGEQIISIFQAGQYGFKCANVLTWDDQPLIWHYSRIAPPDTNSSATCGAPTPQA